MSRQNRTVLIREAKRLGGRLWKIVDRRSSLNVHAIDGPSGEMRTWGCFPLHFLTTSKKVSILHFTAIILLMKSHEVLLFSSQSMADGAGKRRGRSLLLL